MYFRTQVCLIPANTASARMTRTPLQHGETPRTEVRRSLPRVVLSYVVMYFLVKTWALHNSRRVEMTQVSINRWMAKQNVVYQNNGIFSHKINEILHVTTLTNPENSMLRERSQALKNTYDSTFIKYVKTECRLETTGGMSGVGTGNYCIMVRFCLRQWKSFGNSGNCCKTLWI